MSVCEILLRQGHNVSPGGAGDCVRVNKLGSMRRQTVRVHLGSDNDAVGITGRCLARPDPASARPQR